MSEGDDAYITPGGRPQIDGQRRPEPGGSRRIAARSSDLITI
jgi:hypothetical protein